MAITSKTFPVAPANERHALAFDLRANVVDFVRNRVSEALKRAEDAEVDRQTALRRFSLLWAGAAKGYRQVRTVPGSLLNWAAYVTVNDSREGFNRANASTVGTFDKETLQSLENGVKIIRLGGISFAGVLEGDLPEDLYEIRITKRHDLTHNPYVATLLFGRPDGDSPEGIPQPVEPETQDA
jgi:hypothetical protein